MSTPWAPLKNGIWSAPPARGLAETEPIAPSPEPEPEHEPKEEVPVSFAQPHSPSPEPEPEQPPEDDQVVPTGVASFAQPHSRSPSPGHPDDVPDENGPDDDEPEFDGNGYEVEYRGGVRMYSNDDSKDDCGYVEEDIRNYDD